MLTYEIHTPEQAIDRLRKYIHCYQDKEYAFLGTHAAADIVQIITTLVTAKAEAEGKAKEWEGVAVQEQTNWGDACRDVMEANERAEQSEAGAAAVRLWGDLLAAGLGGIIVMSKDYETIKRAQDTLTEASKVQKDNTGASLLAQLNAAEAVAEAVREFDEGGGTMVDGAGRYGKVKAALSAWREAKKNANS